MKTAGPQTEVSAPTMTRTHIRAALTAAALAISIDSASAQAPEDDGALRANCVGDYFRFCAAYVPGSLAIRQCFSRNIERLTPECRGAIRAFDQRAPRRK